MTPLRDLTVLGFLLLVAACMQGLCANTITQRAPSPDGRYDAVVFTRDCGATTDYSTQVALVRRGADLPDRPGNVFISVHPTGARVEWLGSDTLLVHYGSANPSLKTSIVEGITITYAGMP